MRKNKDLFSIFPADAGVNRDCVVVVSDDDDIPRGCGGEPYWARFSMPSFADIPRGCGGEPN